MTKVAFSFLALETANAYFIGPESLDHVRGARCRDFRLRIQRQAGPVPLSRIIRSVCSSA